ncbi:hypothetical protein EDC65_2518 [Stella humosa]|uniref:DUF1150 family protein n=1 Tax=Stella humosa TaxID=94 RepID=A0A3N1L7P5_9PROT|nr:DUF1150 family protein [Stella humosa]ROP90663.1 hypothetical protein EDC65_2518 [Stella humosa]BBK29438.1 hypothetical protein STHU_00720 [Stella humosa]
MNATEKLKQLSVQDFAQLGLPSLAYVRRVMVDDEVRFAIHAADGSSMGIAPDMDVAFAAVRQHDMEPLSVH